MSHTRIQQAVDRPDATILTSARLARSAGPAAREYRRDAMRALESESSLPPMERHRVAKVDTADAFGTRPATPPAAPCREAA